MARKPLPIKPPRQVICVGLNYRDHAEETSSTIPSSPILFAKWPSCLIATSEAILLPEQSSFVDYEAELAVLIGSAAANVSESEALEHVAGYLCFNDVSARDIQEADGQWTRAKSFDTFGPIGPDLVPASEVPDPQALSIQTLINGEIVQDGNTKDMIFSVAELISYISRGITLEPGDLLVTGTPGGIGFTREPQIALQPGDEVRVEIEGIGALVNPVVGSNGRG